ncbi:uncharacterized protein LOC144341620 [Saccoglossus kowalevskii]
MNTEFILIYAIIMISDIPGYTCSYWRENYSDSYITCPIREDPLHYNLTNARWSKGKEWDFIGEKDFQDGDTKYVGDDSRYIINETHLVITDVINSDIDHIEEKNITENPVSSDSDSTTKTTVIIGVSVVIVVIGVTAALVCYLKKKTEISATVFSRCRTKNKRYTSRPIINERGAESATTAPPEVRRTQNTEIPLLKSTRESLAAGQSKERVVLHTEPRTELTFAEPGTPTPVLPAVPTTTASLLPSCSHTWETSFQTGGIQHSDPIGDFALNIGGDLSEEEVDKFKTLLTGSDIKKGDREHIKNGRKLIIALNEHGHINSKHGSFQFLITKLKQIGRKDLAERVPTEWENAKATAIR